MLMRAIIPHGENLSSHTKQRDLFPIEAQRKASCGRKITQPCYFHKAFHISKNKTEFPG